jgi:hypothetical protein
MSLFELLIVVIIVVGFEVVAFLVYLLPDGVPNAIYTLSSQDSTYRYITCQTNSGMIYTNIVIPIWMGINGFFLVLAFLVQLIARNLETPYHEGFFILFAYVDSILLAAIFIPIYYTTGTRLNSIIQNYLIRTLCMLFGTALTMLAICVPKIIAVWKEVRDEREHPPPHGRGAATPGEGGTATSASMAGGTAVSSGSFRPDDSEFGSSGDEDNFMAKNRPQFYSDNVIRRSEGSVSRH